MVLSYQLLSCPRKKKGVRRVPRNGAMSSASTATNTPSKITRSFQSFLHTFRRKNPLLVLPAPTFTEKEKSAPTSLNAVRKTVRSFYLSATKSADTPAAESTPPTSEQARGPTLRERRALRSLYLNTAPTSPRKRYPGGPPSPLSSARHIRRMGRVFQFGDTPPPDTPPGFPGDSPRTPTGRRHYQQLDDALYSNWSNEEVYRTPGSNETERPEDARISPWSPIEEQFPYSTRPPAPFLSPITEVHTPRSPISPYSSYSPRTPTSASPFLLRSPRTPQTPPPLYPPPPAYLPEVPLRAPGLGSAPSTPTRRRTLSGAASASTLTLVPDPPVSPIVSSLRQDIDVELGSWRGHAPIGGASGVDAGAFVISNDSDSEDPFDLESVSMHTDESIEPLKS